MIAAELEAHSLVGTNLACFRFLPESGIVMTSRGIYGFRGTTLGKKGTVRRAAALTGEADDQVVWRTAPPGVCQRSSVFYAVISE